MALEIAAECLGMLENENSGRHLLTALACLS
jgi:hypothetical protein